VGIGIGLVNLLCVHQVCHWIAVTDEGFCLRPLAGFILCIQSERCSLNAAGLASEATNWLRKMTEALTITDLQGALPLVARGKVRDLYEVDDKTLLFIATDRISAFDVIMENVGRPLPPPSRMSFT
jgi:hypothetical protein